MKNVFCFTILSLFLTTSINAMDCPDLQLIKNVIKFSSDTSFFKKDLKDYYKNEENKDIDVFLLQVNESAKRKNPNFVTNKFNFDDLKNQASSFTLSKKESSPMTCQYKSGKTEYKKGWDQHFEIIITEKVKN